MLDLIIPVYKNKAGLYRTLFSVGTELGNKVLVTIVDDASGDTYDDVVSLFQKVFPIRVLTLEKNGGPGIARQYGLDRATQKWVCFIDCGDTFLTPTSLMEMLNAVENAPNLWMGSWAHQEERETENPLEYNYEFVPPLHNRMHGKIYLRQFLMNHGITFNKECPRINEDIGFNIAARLVCRNATLNDGLDHIYEFGDPAVVWKSTGPSIVRANNCEFYYKDQNVGMGKNSQHAIAIARRNNVHEDIILQEIYEEMAHMYCFYMVSFIARPECSDTSLKGCMDYYMDTFYPVRDKNPEMLNACYWDALLGFLNEQGNPIKSRLTGLDFHGWLNQLDELTRDERTKRTIEASACAQDEKEQSGFQFESL